MLIRHVWELPVVLILKENKAKIVHKRGIVNEPKDDQI